MKHLKTFNESIKDFLKPKSREDIKRDLKKLNQNEKDNALTYASENGYVDEVKYLLNNGADVHAENDYALRWASFWGHTDVVKILIDYGVDVHSNWALTISSINKHTDIVNLLLKYGADPNVLK